MGATSIASLVLQIVIYFLQFIWVIYGKIDKFNQEEKEMFFKRMQTVADTLAVALKNEHDVFDENAYLAAIEMEKAVRYKKYKGKVWEILNGGKGISDLMAEPFAGIGVRIYQIQTEVINILKMNLSTEDKAKLISQKLVDVQLTS
jgi:hypothetical protein